MLGLEASCCSGPETLSSLPSEQTALYHDTHRREMDPSLLICIDGILAEISSRRSLERVQNSREDAEWSDVRGACRAWLAAVPLHPANRY